MRCGVGGCSAPSRAARPPLQMAATASDLIGQSFQATRQAIELRVAAMLRQLHIDRREF